MTPSFHRPSAAQRACLDSLRPILVALALRFIPAVCALVVVPAAFGQTSGPGSIQGRVQNGDTGRYLENARVALQGTNREVLTDATGNFRLNNVPAGDAVLHISYLSLASRDVHVSVAGGPSAFQEVVLSRTGDQAQGDKDVVRLDPFLVAATREYNAAAIALNEQRASANLKNVVSTDAFGEINQGNVGEFVKHLPGVTIEYKDGNNPSGINIRGFGTNYTRVTQDGNSIASAAIANTQTPNRQFVLEGASINNIIRIEVTKEPTPDTPANAMGGSVNFVTKSSFEYPRTQTSFRAYLSGNSDELSLSRTAGPREGSSYKVLPSVDGTLVLPLRKDLGFVVSVSDYDQYYNTVKNAPARVFTSAGATLANPYTRSFTTSVTPNEVQSLSGSVKMDWKPFTGHVLSLTASATAYTQDSSSHSVSYSVGNSQPASWGQDFTHGAATGASGSLGGGWQNRHALTRFIGGNYTATAGNWTLDAAATYSNANNRVRDTSKGFFNSVSTPLAGVSRIDIDQLDSSSLDVGSVTAYTASGSVIDTTKLASYNVSQAGSQPFTATDTVTEFRLNLKRDFDTPWFPVAVKVGAYTNDLRRDLHYSSANWTYYGPDGLPNTGDESATPFIDPNYSGKSPGYNLPGYQWLSPWAAWNYFQAHPNSFQQTATQQGDTIKNTAVRSPLLMERVTAGYALFDAKFFRNRLRLLSGVRYELTQDSGYGYKQNGDAIYQLGPDGKPLKVNGAFVLLPQLTNTVSGGPERNQLIYLYRGQYNSRNFHGYYPSAHLTYNITDNLLFRAAYAETLGRPSPSDIVPNSFVGANVAFDSTIPGSIPGFITSSNTTLKPWSGKNYDLALEYYLPNNGFLSAGVFRKDIKHFFQTITQIADIPLLDSLGLSHDFVGYQWSTRINGGDARIDGLELSATQPLGMLGAWGRHFTVNANYTRLLVTGAFASNFSLKNGGGNIPTTGNAGLSANFGRFGGTVQFNYRGRQFRDTSSAYPGATETVLAVETWDASAEYRLTNHFTLFGAVRNLTNARTQWALVGPDAALWAQVENDYTNGAQYSFGVKGSF